MLYEGIALCQQYENGRKAGIIEIKGEKIYFKTDLDDISWYLYDVEFSHGGAGNKLIFIKHKKQQEITIYTHDKKILKDPKLHLNSKAQENVKQIDKHFRLQSTVWIIVGLLILSPIILFFIYRTQLVKKIADQVPVSFEQKAGDQLFALLSKGYTIIKDSTINAQLNEMVLPLVKSINDTTQKFSFYIINDSTVNAFALPGGKVVINSGLILKSDKWSEIQGVIAHEIAHVTQRHHVRGIINQRGFFFIISVFLGGYSDLISIIGEYGGHLESLMYSRKFEFEADNTGCKYMQQAHLDPRGMVSFFHKLLEENKDQKKSNAFYNMLSTHPATDDRIKNLNETISKLKISSTTSNKIKLSDFQNNLKVQLKP